MSLNDFFKRMLGHGTGQATCQKLLRPKKYRAAYQAWMAEEVYLHWTGPLFKSYHYQKATLQGPLRVQLVNESNLNGLIFFYAPQISPTNFTFFFDFLKDRVQDQGYQLHSCDTLEIKHERYTEQIEKHLLTPPASDVPGTQICNQQYGNVLLDYIKVNKQPGYIRFVTNAYNDSYFSKPLPFDELLEKVLAPNHTKNA